MFAVAEQRQVGKGLKVVCVESGARYDSNCQRSHLQKQVYRRFKGCTLSRRCSESVWLSLESTVNIVQGFNGQTYAYFLLESSCFDKSSNTVQFGIIYQTRERRRGRPRGGRGGEAGEQKLGFATVPSSYFIDVGRHRKRAAFTLACRVLLLARESKTISHFEKYGGSWRSHSRAGISRLRAATLSALHLGG